MRLWLDDLRPAPEGWVWVRTAEQAIAALQDEVVLFASLDHDLGAAYASSHWSECDGEHCGFCNPGRGPEVERNLSHKEQTGMTVVDWMIETGRWPWEGIEIHSWNIPGGRRMAEAIDRYGPYPTRCRHIPFKTTDIGQV